MHSLHGYTQRICTAAGRFTSSRRATGCPRSTATTADASGSCRFSAEWGEPMGGPYEFGTPPQLLSTDGPTER